MFKISSSGILSETTKHGNHQMANARCFAPGQPTEADATRASNFLASEEGPIDSPAKYASPLAECTKSVQESARRSARTNPRRLPMRVQQQTRRRRPSQEMGRCQVVGPPRVARRTPSAFAPHEPRGPHRLIDSKISTLIIRSHATPER